MSEGGATPLTDRLRHVAISPAPSSSLPHLSAHNSSKLARFTSTTVAAAMVSNLRSTPPIDSTVIALSAFRSSNSRRALPCGPHTLVSNGRLYVTYLRTTSRRHGRGLSAFVKTRIPPIARWRK